VLFQRYLTSNNGVTSKFSFGSLKTAPSPFDRLHVAFCQSTIVNLGLYTVAEIYRLGAIFLALRVWIVELYIQFHTACSGESFIG